MCNSGNQKGTKQMTEKKAIALILKSKDEKFLLDVNHMVINRIKKLRAMRCMDAISQLQVGDKVHVAGGKNGREIEGVITELRRKKVIVVENGTKMRWKCSANLVSVRE